MTENICKGCIWCDQCCDGVGCEYYDPSDDEQYYVDLLVFFKAGYTHSWDSYIRDRNGGEKLE